MRKMIAVLLISVAASVGSAQTFNGLAATTATLRAISDVTGTDSFSTATLPQAAKGVIINLDVLVDANEIKRGGAVQVVPVGGSGNMTSADTAYTTKLYDLPDSDWVTSAAAITVKKRLVIPRDSFGSYNTFGIRVKGVGATATDGAVGASYQIAY